MPNIDKFLTVCTGLMCGNKTSKAYARSHGGLCKMCADPGSVKVKVRDSDDRFHDYIASGAAAAGVSFSDC